MSDQLPNSNIQTARDPATPQPPANPNSSAMKALERVTGNAEPKIPDNVPVTKPPLKGQKASRVPELPDLDDEDSDYESSVDYDMGDDKPLPKKQAESNDNKNPAPGLPDDTDDIDKIIDITKPSGENMKKLRTKLKTTFKDREALRVENEALRKKVTDFEAGVVLPEQIQQLQSRIDELEPFEKLYSLKTSPHYQKAITQPLEIAKGKLLEIAKDYGVSTDLLQKAVDTTNRAELNKLLNTAGFDEVGALEVKALLNTVKEINAKALEAEKTPSATLARLHKQTEEALQIERSQEVDGIISISKNAWIESLQGLRQEDHLGLSFVEGDTAHNETIVRPILNKASKDYGTIVRTLGENGLKQLPHEISYVLARSIQLAHESALLKHQNKEMSQELNALRKRVGNLNTLNRPGTNGGGYANGASSKVEGSTAAQRSLNRATAQSQR